MREIHISNLKDRNSKVNLDTRQVRASYQYHDPKGRPVTSVRLVKGTLNCDLDTLTAETSLEDLSDALIEGDPEIDFELFGKQIDDTRRIYLNSDHEPVYGVTLKEAIFTADGSKQEERPFQETESNINLERPLKVNAKIKIPLKQAVRMFAFTGCYQITHRDGLTYDFLFDLAKELEAQQVLMMLGAGDKANQPLVITRNGTSYRGFLEGRTRGDDYMLLLHMTNLELKPLPSDEEDA